MKILRHDLLILSLAVAIGYGEANAAEQPNPADDATVVESLRDLNNSSAVAVAPAARPCRALNCPK